MKLISSLYRYLHNILSHLFRKYKFLNRCFNLLPNNIIYDIDNYIGKENIIELQGSYNFINNNVDYNLYDNNIFQNYKNINFPPINSYLIQNAVICTQTGYIIDLNSKSVIAQSYPYGDKFLPHTQFYNSLRNHNITKIQTNNFNSTFLIATTNYCHWFTEFIGRALYFLNQYDNAIIYTNPFLYQWQHQSLELFNIDKSKIQFVYDKYIHFSKVYFVNYCGLGIGLPDSKMIKKLNLTISNNIKFFENNHQLPEHVYITRKKASHRKAINENDLKKILSKYNFKTIDCEDMSVMQQFLTFNKASFIIAIHGPSISNSIAANNSTIVELLNEHHITGSYYHFASIPGNRYIALKCKNIGHPVMIDGNPFFGYNDIEIDLDKLEQIINKFIS